MQTIKLQDHGLYRELTGTAARNFRSTTGRSQFSRPVALARGEIGAYGTVTLLMNPPLVPEREGPYLRLVSDCRSIRCADSYQVLATPPGGIVCDPSNWAYP